MHFLSSRVEISSGHFRTDLLNPIFLLLVLVEPPMGYGIGAGPVGMLLLFRSIAESENDLDEN